MAPMSNSITYSKLSAMAQKSPSWNNVAATYPKSDPNQYIGALTLWLPGHSAEAIMKIGRWRTNTFLTNNIHSQIASLTITRNNSSLMSRRIAFHNVGG